MSAANRKDHWDRVYVTRAETEVSWFQENPRPSLEALARVGAGRRSAIIDVGGGASRLVDRLVEEGFEDVTVLDLSAAALETAKAVSARGRARFAASSPTRRSGRPREPTTSGTIARRSISSSAPPIRPPMSSA